MKNLQEKLMYCGECEVKCEDCEYVEGNVSKSIDIDKNISACEVRVDIEVKRKRTIRIWGQITDCEGKPVKCAMVKLIKEVIECGKKKYEGIAHGITDCLGFYQFDICIPESCHSQKFRVLVSKQAIGEEIIVEGTKCNPCNNECDCIK